MESPHDWTHKNVRLTDIRLLNKLYSISIVHNTGDKDDNGHAEFEDVGPLFINTDILNRVAKSYFLTDIENITRGDFQSVAWNMYITLGHFIKIDDNGGVKVIEQDPDKYYVSFLDISGKLGGFDNILNKK